jgi:D-cysteine desulfhydrase family pyridoxal phosphate-dependent enzyme
MKAIHALKEKIESLPRARIAHLPTPLEEMMQLSRKLGVRLFFKRDDQTGLAFGGNKARKLDFIMADALSAEADTIVTWAGVQSNWCRQTAAAAKKLGVRPILILFKRPSLPSEVDGNLLLDFVFDSDIRLVDKQEGQKMMEYEGVKEVVDAVAEEVRNQGGRPYIAPIGGSLPEASMDKPWGAIGYVNGFIEVAEQMASRGADIDAVVFATGSGSTQGGLLVGAKLISPEARTVGISVSETQETMTRYVRTITDQTMELLGQRQPISDDDIIVFDDYLRGGYGILDKMVAEAIRLVAETEGVLLDPVYTGKAMSGLIDLIEKGYFEAGTNIVFLHSGGTPALFPYRKELLQFLWENE